MLALDAPVMLPSAVHSMLLRLIVPGQTEKTPPIIKTKQIILGFIFNFQ